MKRKKGVSTALTNVQKYFPGVNRVEDGTKPIVIEVTAEDSRKSTALDHRNCALAVACKRQQKADGVIIALKTAYVIFGKRAVRYLIGESTTREIISFDRHAGFDRGTYELKPAPECHRLGVEKPTGPKVSSTGRKMRRKHFTRGIRTMLHMRERNNE